MNTCVLGGRWSNARYAGWSDHLGRSIMNGEATLASLHDRAMGVGEPSRSSGRQEMLENVVARHIARAR